MFLILSRIPQIYTNFISKSTGNLALATFFFAFGGSTARMATVLFETDDFLFQLNYILACLLNTVLLLQFVLYWGSEDLKKVDIEKGTKET